MSGYGYYEEEGQGLMTGAGARAKYKYVYSRVKSDRTGKLYPKRGPMTLEYASKLLFNSNLAKNNKWLEFIRNSKELKDKRAELAALMKKLSQAYKQTLTDEQRARLESRKKPRSKADKLAEARERIRQFKEKYPDAESALPVLRNYLPNIRSARLFLRTVYNLDKDKVYKLLPRRKRLRFRPATFGEYTPTTEGPPPSKPGESELLETSPRREEGEKEGEVVEEQTTTTTKRGRRKKTEE
jgi:hypothetical protein